MVHVDVGLNQSIGVHVHGCIYVDYRLVIYTGSIGQKQYNVLLLLFSRCAIIEVLLCCWFVFIGTYMILIGNMNDDGLNGMLAGEYGFNPIRLNY